METYGCPPKFPAEDVKKEVVVENEIKLPADKAKGKKVQNVM